MDAAPGRRQLAEQTQMELAVPLGAWVRSGRDVSLGHVGCGVCVGGTKGLNHRIV